MLMSSLQNIHWTIGDKKTCRANSLYLLLLLLLLSLLLFSLLLLSLLLLINKTMYHKTWVKLKQSRFNSIYQSLRAFGGHRIHYQVHINTNLKLFARID